MKQSKTRKKALTLAAAGVVALSSFFATPVSSILAAQNHSNHESSTFKGKASTQTTTPIKHVVVIFGENVSFDHYFGTYPNAKNLPGEPVFKAAKNTPKVNGLTQDLLTNNPNKDLNGNTVNPQRMSPSQAMTDSMDHNYTSEQKAQNGGKMDQYVPNGGRNNPVVMNYFDGNTVTGFWNYAQNFAMSDNSFNTTFGPSTPGALNLISGQTHGATVYENDKNDGELNVPREVMNGTVIGDPDPQLDKASNHPKTTVTMSGKNVGDLLNKKDITWGWFQGGFADPKAQHANIAGKMQTDYNPHHEPFQYYPQTANKDHLPPSSPAMIGKTDQANHQYDLKDFWTAADNGNLPAVSYLKAANYQDGHAGYSDPIDEQHFVVETINRLQKLPEWKDTAVVLAYDDSDGWYDHVKSPLVNGSNDPQSDVAFAGPGSEKIRLGNYKDRAGYGPRLPLLIVSPYAKKNFVDHTLTDQTSILRFIEDNWKLGRIGDNSFDAVAGSLNNMFDFSHEGEQQNRKLFLDPATGQPIAQPNTGNKQVDQDGETQDDQNGQNQ